MAVIPTLHGTAGGFSAAGYIAKFTSWTATFNQEVFDTTGFGDLGYKTGEVITGQWTGSAIGVIACVGPPMPVTVPAAAAFGGAAVSVVLTGSGAQSYTFNALITAVELGRAETGAGSSTYRIDFQSTGAPSAPDWA